MSFLDTILSVLAPYDCLGCQTEGSLLCGACIDSLPMAPPKYLTDSSLTVVRSATIYEAVAKDLIWKLKSSGAQSAAKIMAQRMKPLVLDSKSVFIVPVPTAPSRVRQRGYDQAELIAHQLARQTGQRLLKCLSRTSQIHQVGSTIEQRHTQTAGVYKVIRPNRIKGAHVCLVDDVVTTGSTLQAAARVLEQAGASKIDAVVFAQARMRNLSIK